MRPKEKLAAQLGREPSQEELDAERARKRARKAADAVHESLVNLVVIVSTADESGQPAYEKLGGPTSEDEMLIQHVGPQARTILVDMH